MRKPDSYYVEQAQKHCKNGVKPTGKVKRGHDTKIQMTCNNKKHNPYYTTLGRIKDGKGCRLCNTTQRKPDSYYIEQAQKYCKLGTYPTGVIKVVNGFTMIEVACNNSLHHSTYKSLSSIKRGHGCPECYGGVVSNLEEFKSKIGIINSNIEVIGNYCNNHTPIKVSCKMCNYKWSPTPKDLLRGRGCPNCASSSGEQTVASILEFNSINYDSQHNFKIKGKTHRLDFILKDSRGIWCVIQPDGGQHFKSNEYMGGEKEFEHRKQMDRDENKYLSALGIRVLRIPWFWFDLDNTFTLLQDFLGYELKKPSKGYVPMYKNIKEIATCYLSHSAPYVANKYNVKKSHVYVIFKRYFDITKKDYIKLHPSLQKNKVTSYTKVISKPIIGYQEVNKTIVFYPSISSGAKYNKTSRSSIIKCLHGKQKTAGGYKWEYAD